MLFAVILANGPPIALADVLVTRDGERIETRGPWQIKGKQVIFTAANGTLQALRLDDVDLEASDAATHPREAPPPPAVPEAPPRAPVLTITDDDIPRRAAGDALSSGDALISRLRAAHQTRDIGGALDLFYRENMSPSVTQAVRSIFDRVMAGELRNVELQPGPGGTQAPRVDDMPVIGNLLIDIATVGETGETTTERAVFPVVERLGSYVLVAPTTALDAPSAASSEPDAAERVREEAAGSEGP